MERALADVISAGIVGFAIWMFIASLSPPRARRMDLRSPDPCRDWAPERFRRVLGGTSPRRSPADHRV